MYGLEQVITGAHTSGAARGWKCLLLTPSRVWRRNVAIYTIQQVGGPGEITPQRKINCQTDREAMELAQRIADTGLALRVWREDELIGMVIATQSAANLSG